MNNFLDKSHFLLELETEKGALAIGLNKVFKGEFMRGSDTRAYCERPRHKTKISYDYFLGTYPITQEQWHAFGKAISYHEDIPVAPIEKVSWKSATKFCEKVTENAHANKIIPEDFVCRLPTEAEWEYAAWAGRSEYSEEEIEEQAWHVANSEFSVQEVGLRTANDWGFFDILGNVFEWVQDSCNYHDKTWFKDGNTLSPSYVDDIINPLETKGNNKISKGGCWFLKKIYCHPSARYINSIDSRYFNIGFRIVIGPDINK